MSRTSLGDLRPGRGEKVHGWLRVPGIEPVWEVPGWVIRGAEDGPTLAVTAGVHAAEYPPIEAATRFARDLDPAELRGTVLLISLVNTPGFFERSLYVNPRDGKNLNRSYPGRSDGSPAERVTHFLLEELVREADAYLDLHCGDLVEALEPFAMYRVTGDEGLDARARGLAEAYRIRDLIENQGDDVPGASHASAADLGVPAAIVEIGQQGILDEASVGRHLAGLRQVLVHLGMQRGGATPPPDFRRHRRFAWLRASASGALTTTVRCGEQVVEGQPIGQLRDLFGETLAELQSPGTGIVLFLVTSLAVPEGGPIVGVATG
ncbi:MAG: M14 family metallopeptidase [Candidatus Dormiibacterota bacterium]